MNHSLDLKSWMFQKWLWTYSCPECQSRPIVKFEHFDHAKIWKHTQHDIIYNLIGFVGDYITEGLGQNPKFTLCRPSHVVLMLKTNLIIGYFALNFSWANATFAISSDNICFESSILNYDWNPIIGFTGVILLNLFLPVYQVVRIAFLS